MAYVVNLEVFFDNHVTLKNKWHYIYPLIQLKFWSRVGYFAYNIFYDW